ncbi:aldehyde dehydrogenase family protein [Rhodospirillaceae bacterium SYSU D60014]|uniref:aldehyde dehydrogenase family protein n=1 Tax=Virgifigura deserti TaxID=2268457 RepID=UPI000E673A41
MAGSQQTITPIDGSIYVERTLASGAEIDKALTAARKAAQKWKDLPVEERGKILSRAVDAFVARRDEIAEEITRQIGRPLSQAPGEVRGFEERARHMIAIAPEALADVAVGDKPGFTRFIRREPLGVAFVVAPWNFPYLTAVNAVIPALMAGNAVILKHSAQTPLCAERFAQAFKAAGLPKGLFQFLHLSHADTAKLIGSDGVDFVAFTGSVAGGRAVQQAAAERFIGIGLELGGCDPAYVRPDAKLPHAIENLVDGAFFNSGQSCCGIQRIYVHADVYKPFLEGFVDLTRNYRLGNPLDADTNLGPVVRASAADQIRKQVAKAVRNGAKALIDAKPFKAAKKGTAYLAPQVLTVTSNGNPIMQDECFGPVAAIMKVRNDDQAIRLMNDNAYGLTAAIWTADEDAAIRIGDRIATGTWFMNRCDYLDPALAWTGVKDSGRGCTLSKVGYEHLTRPKSFHLRTAI